ncbi:extracellular solute-binding protein [Sinorhizobium medicae]|uniref:extracellular solute-binding protein n=1 Tax=Sinorhizobium medicae TaxID=110321 RepID=UPI0021A454E6|nr:extracellular solute-binding protein [Sinorhizobium medicae]UWU06751.1 extracellular solute-binding protein [Sinorhizobium medicae]
MIKPIISSPRPHLSRRQVLQGVAAAAGAGLAGFPGQLGAASQVKELIVLTGTTPWLPAYQKAAAAYEAEKGIKITFRAFPYGGMRTQMTNAIQSKNAAFDVFQLDEPWTGQFYDNGWVKPLEEIIEGYKLDPNILTYDSLPLWDKQQRRGKAGGKIMGLPINGNVDLFVYRKDIYEKLGLTVPKTWDEAIENGKKAVEAGEVRYGYVTRGQPTAGGQSVSFEFMHVLYGFGGDWFKADGATLVPTINNDAAKTAAATFRRLLELGPSRSQTVGQADCIALMQSGQALQGHFVAAGMPQLEDETRSSVVGKCGYTIVLAGSLDHPVPASGVWSLYVPADQAPERQLAAAEFIMWMLDKKQQEAFAGAGGMPTRKDVDVSGAGALRPIMEAARDSAALTQGAIRYVFAAQMLEAVEPVIGQIGSGDLAVDEGLDELQAKLAEIAKASGFAK